MQSAITEGQLKFPEKSKGVLAIGENPFPDITVNIATLEDLMK